MEINATFKGLVVTLKCRFVYTVDTFTMAMSFIDEYFKYV